MVSRTEGPEHLIGFKCRPNVQPNQYLRRKDSAISQRRESFPATLTAPIVCRRSSTPTVHSCGIVYVFHARQKNDTAPPHHQLHRSYGTGQPGTRTIRHAHAQVINLLPVRERLNDRAAAVVARRVVVVLQEVAHEELALGLRAEEDAEPDGVREAPRERVHEVERERAPCRERREQGQHEGVEYQEDELEVRGATGQ